MALFWRRTCAPTLDVSKVFRDRLEFADHVSRSPTASVGGNVEAVINVIVDQGFLCLTDGLLDGLQLLRQVQARPLLLDHRNDMTKMPLGTAEPPNDLRVGLVNVAAWFSHAE